MTRKWGDCPALSGWPSLTARTLHGARRPRANPHRFASTRPSEHVTAPARRCQPRGVCEVENLPMGRTACTAQTRRSTDTAPSPGCVQMTPSRFLWTLDFSSIDLAVCVRAGQFSQTTNLIDFFVALCINQSFDCNYLIFQNGTRKATIHTIRKEE